MERQGFIRDKQTPLELNPMLIQAINPINQKYLTASPTPSAEELLQAQLQQVFNPNAVSDLQKRTMENYAKEYNIALRLSFAERYLGWKPKPGIAVAGLGGGFGAVSKAASSGGRFSLNGVVPVLVPVPPGWSSKFKGKVKINNSTKRADWTADAMLHYVESGLYHDHLASGGMPDVELDAIDNQIIRAKIPQEVIQQATGITPQTVSADPSGIFTKIAEEEKKDREAEEEEEEEKKAPPSGETLPPTVPSLTQPGDEIEKLERQIKDEQEDVDELTGSMLGRSATGNPLALQTIRIQIREGQQRIDDLRKQIALMRAKSDVAVRNKEIKDIEEQMEGEKELQEKLRKQLNDKRRNEKSKKDLRSKLDESIKSLGELEKRRNEFLAMPGGQSETAPPSPPGGQSETTPPPPPGKPTPTPVTPARPKRSPWNIFQSTMTGSGLTATQRSELWKNQTVKRWVFANEGLSDEEIVRKFNEEFPTFKNLSKTAFTEADITKALVDDRVRPSTAVASSSSDASSTSFPSSSSDSPARSPAPQFEEQLLPSKGGMFDFPTGRNDKITIDPITGAVVISHRDPPPGGGTSTIEIPRDPVGGRTETDQPFPKPPDPTETEEEKKKKDDDDDDDFRPIPPPPPPPTGPITRPIDPRPPPDDDDDDDDEDKPIPRSTQDEKDRGHGWLRPKFERGGQRKELLLDDQEVFREIVNWTLFDLPMPANERMNNPMYRKRLRDMFVRYNGFDGKWRSRREFEKNHRTKNRAVRKIVKPHLQEFPYFTITHDKLHGGRYYLPQQPRKVVNSRKYKRYIKSAEPVMLPHYSVQRRVGDGFVDQKDSMKRGSVFKELNPAHSRDINKKVEYRERAGLVYPEVGHVMNKTRRKEKPVKNINLHLAMK